MQKSKKEFKDKERIKLMIKFAKNRNSFWKDLSKLRRKNIEIEIEDKVLIEHYKKHVGEIENQSMESKELDKKFKDQIDRYKALIKNKLGMVKIGRVKIFVIMGELKNNKKVV